MKSALGKVAPDDLLKEPLPEWEQAQLELLLSWVAHDADHGGRINYVKGLPAPEPRGPLYP